MQADCLMNAAETLLGLGDDYPNSPEAQREIKALESKVRRKYKVKTSLKGIDPEVARRVVANLDMLFARYPKMKPYFRFLSTLTNRKLRQGDDEVIRAAKLDAKTWDWDILMSCSSTSVSGEEFGFGIAINPTNFRRMEMTQRMLDTMERNGILPGGCNSVEALTSHEFGHAMLQIAMLEMDETEFLNIEKEMTEGKQHDTLLNWKVMGDAETDAEEIWADAFAAIHHAPSESLKDSQLAQVVRDCIDNYHHLYE